MDADAHMRLNQAREDGARLHASWNAAVFESYCEGPIDALWNGLRENKHQAFPEVWRAYVTLVREGVGCGSLSTLDPDKPSNLLELALGKLIPEQVPHEPPETQVRLMAKAWNLGEGILREPGWLNAYAMCRADSLSSLGKLEDHLTDLLTPVLSPQPPSRWTKPVGPKILDARPFDGDFLPGEMHLTAPAVLCVRDRLRPVQLGVLLQKGGASEIIGPIPESTAYPERFEPPKTKFEPSAAWINRTKVDLPLLGTPRSHVCTEPGFLVVAAEDSQRLWIVETT
ncbi:MAG: hypothetical protein N2C14_24930 [Planctomycetales bacterium]